MASEFTHDILHDLSPPCQYTRELTSSYPNPQCRFCLSVSTSFLSFPASGCRPPCPPLTAPAACSARQRSKLRVRARGQGGEGESNRSSSSSKIQGLRVNLRNLSCTCVDFLPSYSNPLQSVDAVSSHSLRLFAFHHHRSPRRCWLVSCSKQSF